VRLHDLRHFTATQLIHAGMDIWTVADFLGHSDPSLTLRVYSHAIEERNRAAATIMSKTLSMKKEPVARHPAHKTCDVSDETDLEPPGLAGAETIGRITVTQLDWWSAISDVLNEAVAVIEWDELHVERRTVGPVIDERPPQRLTVTIDAATAMLGISRATAYDAVSRGVIPCIRIGRRILIPKVALERLLEGGGYQGT
jgi:excisionase family DNA binding protein